MLFYLYLGVKNFFSDLEQMLGKKHWIFWLYCGAMWTAITPIVIVVSRRGMGTLRADFTLMFAFLPLYKK